MVIPMVPAPQLRLVVGCEFDLVAPVPTSAVLQIAPAESVTVRVDAVAWDTVSAHHQFVDVYGNRCERFALPAGHSRIGYRADVTVADELDEVALDAVQIDPGYLPDEMLHWLMPSRFCQSDELGAEAWSRFGGLPGGWSRVQAVCDFVHHHLEFLPGSSNSWTTAADAHRARQGVCRDFAHLAITFCRALNIPARYVFGYLPDIRVPVDGPMDYAAWFEVYLGGSWRTFDARNNQPRTGRVVVGRGRDAVDVAMITSLGALELTGFHVVADQVC